MSILLIDFEATSVDPKTARVIEIGARVVSDDWSSCDIGLSHLVWAPGYPEITPEVEQVTGITQELLSKEALEPRTAFAALGRLVTPDIKFVVAYNTAYDAVLFKEEMFRHELTMDGPMSWLLTVPWLCAMADIEKNYEFKSWRLAHVALEHGCTVCLKDLHRAINDVDLMYSMLQLSGTTPEAMYDFQCEPWIYVSARVEKPWLDGGKSSAFAKKAGFNWETCKGDYSGRVFAKQWVTRIKQKNYDKLLTLPIQVERILI